MRARISNTLATAVPSICRRCESQVNRFQVFRSLSSTSQSLAPPRDKPQHTNAGHELEKRLIGSESPISRLSTKTRNAVAKPAADEASFSMLETMNSLTKNPYGERPAAYHLHVYAHKHNTHLTLTRPNRDPMLSLSCGSLGFRKSHRGGYDPAYQLSSYVMGKIQERGFLMEIKALEVVLRGYGPGREAFTKILLGQEGKVIRNLVTQVTDATRLKFGGVLLVPTTESLTNSRDRDSNILYSDLVVSEEFLGSHVLRISPSGGSGGGKDGTNVRDSKGKAKQVTTVNGRTVIIKENSVYSNKGFKSLSQAQLLSDALYYAPNNESKPWLIYNISKPLIGSFDPCKIVPAVVPGQPEYPLRQRTEPQEKEEHVSSLPKREVGSFRELLSNFPMIARQMQPGLERLFREFGKELGKPLPPPPSTSPSVSSRSDDRTLFDDDRSVRSSSTTRFGKLPFNSEEYFDDDENLMRRALETAVTAAIDLFRLVDKQQLSLLGATTDLTGPLVERLIERYVAEQVHDSLLFPRLCGCHEAEDTELDTHIRQMENIDVSQVGISIDGGRQGKEELIQRLGKGVEEFRKIAEARCPQDMLKALLATVQVVSMSSYPLPGDESSNPNSKTEDSGEKQPSTMTVNADILVSLLLMVVIRSHVRHLQARLAYMQHFIYIDDVESGEIGYALSTLEAVLTYLLRDFGGLRKASIQNKRLWSATKRGRISDMKAVLERDEKAGSLEEITSSPDDFSAVLSSSDEELEIRENSNDYPLTNGTTTGAHAPERTQPLDIPETPTLSHVFPFQQQQWIPESPPKNPPRTVKKVSMDMRSLSGSSAISLLSRTTTMGSTASGIEGDTSIESLTQTQDPAGDSVPMMAVEGGQPEALKYLLSLEEYYPPKTILEDTNSDGTTLLSAAVQLGHTELVDIILDFVYKYRESHPVTWYFSKPDIRGRTVAHYLFSTPSLMSRLGTALPWRQRDRNGQTPLFALCRSYDHPDYKSMVNDALSIAREAQGDGNPLRLDDHIDAKGNTLLHIVSDPQIILRILRECDCDPNATNDKRFTPLMMASKYGRVDLVRTFFQDPRVDVYLKEFRGLTAVELAKDDDVRNRIDDLILLSNPPSSPSLDPSGRVTTVVRSFFVEDATVRFIIKSGAPNPPKPGPDHDKPGTTTYTVTTCRRNLTDFENLAHWLSIEHPASYIPSISDFRPPFQIHSRPSRAVLHDTQERLDRFLKIMLAHSTFATHEMLWEFFLVPEIQPEMMEERSRRKAVVLAESISDDYEPVNPEGIRDVEQFISHAQDMVRSVNANTRSLIRRGQALQYSTSDFADAVTLCSNAFSTLQAPTNALPLSHIEAISRFATYTSTSNSDSSPLIQFLASIISSHSTTTAILTSLARPTNLISTLNSTNRSLSRSRSSLISSSLPRKFNLNLPGLEESRQKSVRDLEQKIEDTEKQVARLGKEIAWNKDVVVGELAGWTSWREKVGRDAIRTFVRASLVREKERGRRLERCLRNVREAKVVEMG
ncbi:hypothetical protein FQN54_005680 [Arachnomyces sp. PD_36]|nr:hypothetical protein FQN54_005680 [Arachnomyces sp. PD_36]